MRHRQPLSITDTLYTCRPDLVGFVNGLPLVAIELKQPGVPVRAAFDENLTHYKQEILALFYERLAADSRIGFGLQRRDVGDVWGRHQPPLFYMA